MNKKISVIVPAAGAGLRMNSNRPKQYLELCDKPILVHTIETLQRTDSIEEIILVAPEDNLEYVKSAIVELYRFTKVKSVVAGGTTRQKSVYNGMQEVSENIDFILVHDAVRPLIQPTKIDEMCQILEEHEAVVLGMPVKNTIKSIHDGFVDKTYPRENLWAIQTPQGMRASVFRNIMEKANTDGFEGTDEASVAENYKIKVKIIEGDYRNIKITTRDDLRVAETFLNNCL
jgi:2-C-methyl-D-erythritol 4-phosphate cytidylyltransferase